VIEIGTLADVPGSAAVEIAAGEFADVATQLDGAMDAVASGWTGLAAEDVYDGPGADRVYAAMDAPKKVAQMVAAEAKNARRVLDDYASTLADLATRRASLASDVDAHTSSMDDTFDDEDSIGARDTPGGRLADDVAKFNRDVAAADEDCARRLRALSKYGGPLRWKQSADALASNTSSALIGLGQGLAQRVRYTVVATEPLPTEPELVDTEDVFQNREYALRPGSSLLVPRQVAQSEVPQPKLSIKTEPHYFTTVDPDVAPQAIPGAAKIAGRALGVAGFAFTIADAGSEQYQKDLESHPEWTQDDRLASASKSAVVVGGFSAAGSWAGAGAGAELGMALGSVIPGPGTAIGGIIGGIAGGIIGGNVGSDAGEEVKSAMDGAK